MEVNGGTEGDLLSFDWWGPEAAQAPMFSIFMAEPRVTLDVAQEKTEFLIDSEAT